LDVKWKSQVEIRAALFLNPEPHIRLPNKIREPGCSVPSTALPERSPARQAAVRMGSILEARETPQTILMRQLPPKTHRFFPTKNNEISSQGCIDDDRQVV
jgi:hypothetical protein